MRRRMQLDTFMTLPADYIPGKIGVVTVLYNSALVLPDFFASIDLQSYPHYIVYCVDNASQDGSATMCADHGDRYVVIENEKNVGFAAGTNQGIRAAIRDGCEYVLFLNNDVAFGGNLLQTLLEGMRLHNADMTTPVMYFHEPANRVLCAGGGFNRLAGNRQILYRKGETDTDQFNTDRRVDFSPACCVLARRALFERVGLLDERYFVYWEDTDWMLRAKKAGASLWFLHAAKLWHKVSSLTGRESEFTVRYESRNHAYYFYKHLSPLPASLYSMAYRAFYGLSSLQPGRRKKARLSLRSWGEGMLLYRSAIELAKRESFEEVR